MPICRYKFITLILVVFRTVLWIKNMCFRKMYGFVKATLLLKLIYSLLLWDGPENCTIFFSEV